MIIFSSPIFICYRKKMQVIFLHLVEVHLSLSNTFMLRCAFAVKKKLASNLYLDCDGSLTNVKRINNSIFQD